MLRHDDGVRRSPKSQAKGPMSQGVGVRSPAISAFCAHFLPAPPSPAALPSGSHSASSVPAGPSTLALTRDFLHLGKSAQVLGA